MQRLLSPEKPPLGRRAYKFPSNDTMINANMTCQPKPSHARAGDIPGVARKTVGALSAPHRPADCPSICASCVDVHRACPSDRSSKCASKPPSPPTEAPTAGSPCVRSSSPAGPWVSRTSPTAVEISFRAARCGTHSSLRNHGGASPPRVSCACGNVFVYRPSNGTTAPPFPPGHGATKQASKSDHVDLPSLASSVHKTQLTAKHKL